MSEYRPTEGERKAADTPYNPYARRDAQADGVSDMSAKFAPPPKFELPRAALNERIEPMRATAPAPAAPNVYQTRRTAEEEHAEAQRDYRIEPERPARKRGKRHIGRYVLIGLVAAAVLVLGLYLAYDALKPEPGAKPASGVAQPIETALLIGYDASPALQVSEKAKRGINAVASGLDLEPYAVTASNVIARVATGGDRYDYYLFTASTGRLLGYYEGLSDRGMLICEGDAIYVDESPYLINAEGLPLIDASRYQQYVGADAILSPMRNGWSVISDARRTTFNYINAQGELLSQLWFAKAYPFTGDATVAYVDTGNQGDDRYALYELTAAGGMQLWLHAADMAEVVGSACGMAYLQNGDVVRLDGARTVLCRSSEVCVYVDCAAMVVRDDATGKRALYVNNEPHYDAVYDTIAPVASDMRWSETVSGGLTLRAVVGAAYPQPLSHYFTLTREGGQEQVALSTTSVCPVALDERIEEVQP